MEKQGYKKHFSVAQYYKAFLLVYGAIGPIKKNRKTNLISQQFVERIMLRVTEVNGCSLRSSYSHFPPYTLFFTAKTFGLARAEMGATIMIAVG